MASPRVSAKPAPATAASSTAAPAISAGTARREGARRGRGGGPSSGSCVRICRSSSRSSGPGSRPSSSIEPRARAAVRLECLGLPAAAVEREHQLPVQPLPSRVLVDERLELRHELGCAAGCEQSASSRSSQRQQPQLLEPCDLYLRERLVGEVGQRLADPERECLVEPHRRRRMAPSAASRRAAATSSSKRSRSRVTPSASSA